MKKVHSKINPRHSNDDPYYINTNTNHIPTHDQITYRDNLLSKQQNDNNKSNESFNTNNISNQKNESATAKITINNFIIDNDSSLPNLAERYDSETEDEDEEDEEEMYDLKMEDDEEDKYTMKKINKVLGKTPYYKPNSITQSI